MRTITAIDANRHFPRLLREVAGGATVTIVSRDRPVAVLTPSQIGDALIVSVCAESKCRVLLSEDMQHGFAWGGVTIVNPFTHPTHPRLLATLG